MTALLSADGAVRLPGTLADGTPQRGPPGDLPGLAPGLYPAVNVFADLLAGLALPPPSGASLPPNGNFLPGPQLIPARMPLVGPPGVSTLPIPASPLPGGALPGGTLPGGTLPNLPPGLAPPVPAEDAPGVAPPAQPAAPASEASREPALAAQPVEARPGAVTLRAATAWLANPPASEHPRGGSPAPAPTVPAAAAAEPAPTASPPAPFPEWARSERPIKLEPQGAQLEARSKDLPTELPGDVKGLARKLTSVAVIPEPGGAVPVGPTTAAPAASHSAPTSPLPMPLTQAPFASVDPAVLADRVHWMIDHSVGEARLKLNPPELGALNIRISMIDEKAYVHLAASQVSATDLLEAALPRLRELLNAGGLELAGATVSHDGAEHSTPPPWAEPPLESLDAPDVDGETPINTMPAKSAAGQIDLYA